MPDPVLILFFSSELFLLVSLTKNSWWGQFCLVLSWAFREYSRRHPPPPPAAAGKTKLQPCRILLPDASWKARKIQTPQNTKMPLAIPPEHKTKSILPRYSAAPRPPAPPATLAGPSTGFHQRIYLARALGMHRTQHHGAACEYWAAGHSLPHLLKKPKDATARGGTGSPSPLHWPYTPCWESSGEGSRDAGQ